MRLQRPHGTLDDWVAIAQAGLARYSGRLTFRTTTGGGRQLGATHSHSPEPIFGLAVTGRVH